LSLINIRAYEIQYYIYTKDTLPMDIEFIVQDVFALTRPQWKLASNIEEASRAFQLAVAQDQKTSGLDKAAEPADADSDGPSDGEIDDGEAEVDAEAGIGEAEEESESDEEAEASVLNPTHRVKRNLLEQIDANGDVILSAPATDSEEESIVVTRQEEQVNPEDEADFEREYAKMMAESLESRKHDRKPTFDVPLPMRRKERDTSAVNESWTEESAAPNTPSGTMAFSLLTKRGNRQQVGPNSPLCISVMMLTCHFLDSHSCLSV
jgi:regulator of nonsense transcripts 2